MDIIFIEMTFMLIMQLIGCCLVFSTNDNNKPTGLFFIVAPILIAIVNLH